MSSNFETNGQFNNAKAGFWSSLAFAVLLIALNISFAIMAIQVPAAEWSGMEVYARTYRIVAFIPQAIGLASIPALILMLASIHVWAGEFRNNVPIFRDTFGDRTGFLSTERYAIERFDNHHHPIF